ncbi:MAG: hypothetical protein FWG67_03445 [Defluviitaleaceae bacterium]|nr:hypothetical protein [Defluviitaleaceae bacterium]
MLMASLILLPVIFGIVLYKLPLKLGKVVLLGVQACLLALAVFLFLQTGDHQELYTILGGDHLILNIVLRADRLSMLLVLTNNFLFGLGFVYKMRDKFFDGKIMLLYLILQGLTSGIFLTDDFFNLFIFFEVSTVLTTLLLMFKKEGRVVYDALYYLITQMISMMFFLLGVGFLYRMFGMLSISGVAHLIPYAIADGRAGELVLPFSLMMAGLCFKLGIFPMHGWVSRAYALNSAPITQIAVMSSIMMKTSLYWLFHFHEMFLAAFDYSLLFIVFAVATSIYGAIKAISQKDLRLMLAYSTVSQVGFMLAARFLGDTYSVVGSSYHIITHALFKMLLFLSLGLIIRKYKTADIREIRGLMKNVPFAGVLTIIGMLSITGFPFTSGSVSKYFMSAGLGHIWLEVLFWVMSFCTILVFVKYAKIFLPTVETEKFAIKRVKQFTLLLLTGVTLLLGVVMNHGINFLLGVNFTIDMGDFLMKGFIYVVLVVVATWFYKQFLYKRPVVYEKIEHSLSFSKMCFVLMIFFTTLVVYGLLVVN